MVKLKVIGQTLHVTESQKSLQVNHKNRRYTIDTFTRQNKNNNFMYQTNLNHNRFENRAGNKFLRPQFQPKNFQNTCLNLQITSIRHPSIQPRRK